MKEKIGIVLANTGTPSASEPKQVGEFIFNLLMDKRLAPMNRVLWFLLLRLFIIPKRSKHVSINYKKIWTDKGSPSQVSINKLASRLQADLDLAFGKDCTVVQTALLYSNPVMQTTLDNLKNCGCTKLIVLPMFPQSAYTTKCCVEDRVKWAVKKLKWNVDYTVIQNYYENQTYLNAIAASIKHAGFDANSNDKLLFTFHAIPLNDIDAGDTYELQASSTCLEVANIIGLDRKRWTLGFHSKFDDDRKWLSPFSDSTIIKWAALDQNRVFVVCPGFSIDCLESLYDVDIVMRKNFAKARAEKFGQANPADFVYVNCLGATGAHVKVLSDVFNPYIMEAINGQKRK